MNTQFNASTPTRAITRSYLSPSRQPAASASPQLKHSSSKKQQKQINESNRYNNYNPEKEPIKAYLRIRPKSEKYQCNIEEPYIKVVDNVEVTMTPPENSNAYRTRNRAPERYRFTKVFQDMTSQETFFEETALDLVEDVLNGNNALIFAYGVTNSGKTHTVMGKQDDVGLLPRSLSMMFKSIKNYKSQTKIKPIMHSLLQTYQNEAEENRHTLHSCNIQQEEPCTDFSGIDIDPNFEYGIWISFIEVYNEQVYDLLDTTTKLGMKRTQLHLKYEQKSGNKYVADMNMIKVNSIEEANGIMAFGQQNRQVFSTLMNQTSSRSHSIFTIHLVRCPIDENNFVIEDPNYATLSKLSIVDLAGSERYKNTNSTGQRLKEAGNINKSLMVLGQCMEVLRVNQIKTEMGKVPSIVPFRHSKLTELFKSTFEGDGKAVIIVNVNPFDTGFDENSHVMKFAAVAKDVTTWRQIQPKLDLQHVKSNAKRLRTEVLGTSLDSMHGVSDGEEKEEDGDENYNDYFVDSLINELDDLNNKWIDAETRATNAEIDVRAQVSKENENELRKMEEMYLLALKRESDMMESQISNRLQQIEDNSDVHSTDEKNNALLTMLHERQQAVAKEMNNLSIRIKQSEATHQEMSNKISELEKENQKEKQNNQLLLAKLYKIMGRELQIDNIIDSRSSTPLSNKFFTTDHQTEDEDEDDILKENDDPKVEQSFNNFLRLRKQLRRSIFKREELCKDADEIMNQVEHFGGVTFKLAKETKMGKLLKLIAQEEFEKDPYQIRNRAVKLFKRYAQLPNASSESTTTRIAADLADDVQPPGKAFSSMNLDVNTEPMDIQSLRAENARLKQQIKIINNGQNRLKEAFERTRVLHRNRIEEDIYMIDSSTNTFTTISNGGTVGLGERDEYPNEAHQESTCSSITELNNEHNDLTTIKQNEAAADEEEYESDSNELLKQKMRHKRRRKLRSS